jgi:hypothetical protein
MIKNTDLINLTIENRTIQIGHGIIVDFVLTPVILGLGLNIFKSDNFILGLGGFAITSIGVLLSANIYNRFKMINHQSERIIEDDTASLKVKMKIQSPNVTEFFTGKYKANYEFELLKHHTDSDDQVLESNTLVDLDITV